MAYLFRPGHVPAQPLEAPLLHRLAHLLLPPMPARRRHLDRALAGLLALSGFAGGAHSRTTSSCRGPESQAATDLLAAGGFGAQAGSTASSCSRLSRASTPRPSRRTSRSSRYCSRSTSRACRKRTLPTDRRSGRDAPDSEVHVTHTGTVRRRVGSELQTRAPSVTPDRPGMTGLIVIGEP